MNFWKNKKIIITGGAGFIGSHLSNSIYDLGASVIAIDNLERGKKQFLRPGITFVKNDLKKKSKKITELFADAFAVFHFASKVGGMNYYLNNQFQVMKDNITIDNNVLEIAKLKKVKNYFYASSSHVYPLRFQSTKKIIKLNEKHAELFQPSISYGWAKLIGEKQISYLKNSFQNTFIARYVGIYGPAQDASFANGSLIPALTHKAIKYPKSNFEVLTDGSEIRSYCYIDDAINCSKKLIEKFGNKNNNHHIINICSNNFYTVKQIAKIIVKISKKKIIIKYNKNNVANIKSQFCSNNKVKKIIKWKPKINLINGIKITYKDIQKRYDN